MTNEPEQRRYGHLARHCGTLPSPQFTEKPEGNQNMRPNMRRILPVALTLLALAGLAPLLGACHTTAGVGQDLSAGGHAVTNSAEKHTP